MFTIETRALGPLEGTQPLTDYILSNPATGEWATVLPEFGGILRQLVLRKGDSRYTLISSPGSAQALLADETYASALMFPFPSRIRHGIYHFEGQDYVLAMNETARNNALHGFVHPKPFRVVAQEATDHHALLTVQYDYTGDPATGQIGAGQAIPGYPFPFSLAITYTLTQEGLSFTYNATNTGQTRCPVAFGWHPYFTLNNTSVDELEVSIPAQAVITLDEAMIPTGLQPVPAERLGTFSLRDTELDTPSVAAFSDFGGHRWAVTSLRWPAEDVTLNIAQSDALPYIVVYTPPRRDSIAIEPQTANVNAFNNGEGLVVLNPGENLHGEIKVGLT